MYIDKLLQVSAQQALTGTSLVASTDVIDLGSDRDIGPGEPLWFVVAARTGLGGTGGPTIKFAIQTDSDSGFGTVETLLELSAIDATAFATGKRVVIPMPFTNKRYVRLAYTMTGTSPTATVDAWLTNQEPTSWTALPDAI